MLFIVTGDKLRKMHIRKLCPMCFPMNQQIATRSLSVFSSNKPAYIDYDRRLNTSSYIPKIIPALGFSLHNRTIHTSVLLFASEPLKPSSKVEETVQALKEKAKENLEASLSKTEKVAVVGPPKKSLKEKIKDEIIHYYHGFRLLFIDINVSRKLIWRVLNGKQLTRREHKLVSTNFCTTVTIVLKTKQAY